MFVFRNAGPGPGPTVVEIPEGFGVHADGRIYIDDPSLTRLVKSEPFDGSDEMIQATRRTSRWVDNIRSWIPLSRFREFATVDGAGNV